MLFHVNPSILSGIIYFSRCLWRIYVDLYNLRPGQRNNGENIPLYTPTVVITFSSGGGWQGFTSGGYVYNKPPGQRNNRENIPLYTPTVVITFSSEGGWQGLTSGGYVYNKPPGQGNNGKNITLYTPTVRYHI